MTNLPHLTEEERRDWELAQKATKGPWSVEQIAYPLGLDANLEVHAGNYMVAQTIIRELKTEMPWMQADISNTSFIAAARTGYPAALERLNAALERAEQVESRLRDLREKSEEHLQRIAYEAYDRGFMERDKKMRLHTFSGFLANYWPEIKKKCEWAALETAEKKEG